MVVVNVIGNIDGSVDVADGGCVGVINDDVAAFMGMEGLIVGAVCAGGSPQACEAMLQVLGSSVDVPTSFSRCSGMFGWHLH